MRKKVATVIVNFGGPRNLEEVESFLKELLTDPHVVHSKLPQTLHRLFFTYISKKRARKVRHDYASIGGGSPIFEDTERIAKRFDAIPFHRYLVKTHDLFIENMERLDCEEIAVFPMYPQYSDTTTGSAKSWFEEQLPKDLLKKMRWIESYPTHPAYIAAMQQVVAEFLEEKGLDEKKILLLFSAHGLPQKYVEKGDPYEKECQASFEAISQAFPEAHCRLSYQSKFGRGKWLQPYTSEVCRHIQKGERSQVVFVPLSFTSDHIETLFEIEQLYLPIIARRGLEAYRCPALNHHPLWMEAIGDILEGR